MIHLARAVLAEENPSFRAVFTAPTQPKVTVLLRYDETGADGYLHYVARVVVGPHVAYYATIPVPIDAPADIPAEQRYDAAVAIALAYAIGDVEHAAALTPTPNVDSMIRDLLTERFYTITYRGRSTLVPIYRNSEFVHYLTMPYADSLMHRDAAPLSKSA
jgi:hypothetical protein